jgi:hypothetical protein
LAIDAIKRAAPGSVEQHSLPLKEAIADLANELGSFPFTSDQTYPLDAWCVKTTKCLDLAKKALYWARDLPTPESKDDTNVNPAHWAQTKIHALIGILSDIEEEITSQRWTLANAKAALLTGPAGIGKSHLLAEIVEHQILEGNPAILLLGGSFGEDEPWHQILMQLDRPPTEQIKHFLGALDAAAQAAGTRALVCIDALNERRGIDVWPDRLAAFLKGAEAFPRIGIILSCRLTYVQYVVPRDINENTLARIQHQGFAVYGGNAAKAYLDRRGFVRSGVPNLVPEFENPLFLKTCCDFLEREGKKEFPRGLRGVTSIFKFYVEAITRALNHRMGLDSHLEMIPKAISGFASLLVNAGEGYIKKTDAINFFESVMPSNGELRKSLLSQLESEGLITVEPVLLKNGSKIELVRFTFERFSDHAIAQQLLNAHIDSKRVEASFAVGMPLHDFVFGSKNHSYAGVIEAIAIQLPERTGSEILDFDDASNWTVKQAFITSLLWRESRYFTDKTFKLVRQVLDNHDFINLMIALGTEPENKFNAAYLHSVLMPKTMPDRDQFWSTRIAELGYSGNIEALISWSINNGFEEIEDDRAYLVGVMLTWLLTTTNRPVRDKATKGLACVLSRRLGIAARLLRDFSHLNDVYVLERLLAACYGAALQSNSVDLAELSITTFELVFSNGSPPVDALLRDHARGIVEYARWRRVLPSSINTELARPPYKSVWPIEYVSDEIIESYTDEYPNGIFRDQIVGSSVNDGDFARYQLDYKIAMWSPMPKGVSPLPNDEEVYDTWLKDFSERATDAQMRSFNNVQTAAKLAKHVGPFETAKESELRQAALSAFKAILSSDQWEEFRVKAERFVLHQLYSEWKHLNTATFNIGWARRWVCKRAHELGWTTGKFGEFDRRISSHDRHDHKVERIGKKYQWIALRELIARMADNLAFIRESSNPNSEPQSYQGAQQINLRDIDPSLLTMGTHYDGWAEWNKTWWVPISPNLRSTSPLERRVWAKSDSDIINHQSLIEVVNPKDGRHWLALWGFSIWRGHGVRNGYKEQERETWFRLQCIVVPKKDELSFIRENKNRILVDPHSLPRIDLHNEFFLGEYPWHPALKDVGLEKPLRGTASSKHISVQQPVATYVCERGGYDYSIDKTISLKMPAPWLAEAMGLRLASGKVPAYVDSTGQIMFYDPSILEAGPTAALVDRSKFIQMLDREKLSAFWIVAGEKSAYGGRDAGMGFGGRMSHTTIYQRGPAGLMKHFEAEWLEPSKQQLAEFFGEASTVTTKKDTRGRTQRFLKTVKVPDRRMKELTRTLKSSKQAAEATISTTRIYMSATKKSKPIVGSVKQVEKAPKRFVKKMTRIEKKEK